METMNATTRESRKKYLAPLVVLLLCVVSLTGAAYAYSSSVTIEDNTVTGDEYVLQVYDSTKTNLISDPLTLKALELTHVTIIGDSDSVKVVAEAKAGYSYVGKLTLKDTEVTGASGNPYIYADVTPATSPTFTVEGSSIQVGEAPDPVYVGDGEFGYSVIVELFTNEACSSAYTAGNAITFTSGIATLWYKVTVTAEGDGITFNNNTAQDDITAVKNALNGMTYTLSFVAQPTARAP